MTVEEFLKIPYKEDIEFVMINYCDNYKNISFTKDELKCEKCVKKDIQALKIKEVYIDNGLVVELKFDKNFFKLYNKIKSFKEPLDK